MTPAPASTGLTAASGAPDDACYHCGLPVPRDTTFSATIDGVLRRMCCPGCAAVAELIVTTGLGGYYRYREQPGSSLKDALLPRPDELARYDRDAIQRIFVRTDATGARGITLALEGLRCAACVWLIEAHLRRQPGVVDATVSLAAERAEVLWREGETRLSTLLDAVARLGYRAYPYRPDVQETLRRTEYREALKRLAVAGLGMMQVMMFGVGLWAGALQGIAAEHRDFLRWVSAILTAPVVGYAAQPFFSGAWRDVRNGRAGMDVPIALALAGTYAASLAATLLGSEAVYFESVCMFVFFIAVARFLEMRARHQAARVVEGALRRTPAWTTRLVDGRHEIVSVYELAAGDRVLVKPGETIPADGVIVEGTGWVNEAMLTGEEWPRSRSPGDAVVAGTQNGATALTVAVERTGADTVLASLVRMVDRAARERPAIAMLADRIAGYFVPAILLLTLGVGVAWWHLDAARAAWIMLAVLVVSCPCALSLATPAALAAATGHLLRRGLLVTRAHVIEALANTTDVVFDKTGTLTVGRFRLTQVLPLGNVSRESCIALARALEQYSEHPIARAFVSATTDGEPLDVPGTDAARLEGVRVISGCGLEGRVGGHPVRIGRADWACGSRPAAPRPDVTGNWILLADDRRPLCWFEVADAVRPEAGATVQALRRLGITPHIVSGDEVGNVARVATRLAVARTLGRATPDEKLRYVRALQEQGKVVVMVGDGVNDSPSLSGAQVSVALGSGTDLARGVADSVLMREDLGVLAEAVVTARRTRAVIAENLGWALVYNVVALPLAAAGLVAPYWAALGMSTSSLVVVLNAVRLGRPSRRAFAAELALPWTSVRLQEGG